MTGALDDPLGRCQSGRPHGPAGVKLLGGDTQFRPQTQLTAGNINVMLYRARLKLQKCLQQNWLESGERA